MGRPNKIIDLVGFIPGPIQLVYPEEWRYITNNEVNDVKEGYYIISSYGRVYSLKTSCLLNQVISNTGYYRVFLRLNNGTGRYFSVHRIMMKVFCPINNYNSLQVNHKDGNKLHNTYFNSTEFENLEWCTCQENIIHSINSNLKYVLKGEECSYANITNIQADNIAYMISLQQYSHEEIARINNCPVYTVNGIASGTIWKEYYNKYNLESVKRKFNLNFTDNQLHLLFKYFEDHSNEYISKSDLYRNALKDLFNIDFNPKSMSGTMSRLFNRQTRKEISDQYNF